MKALLFIFTLLASCAVCGQSVEQFLEWAEMAKQNGDHRGTAEFYEQVLKREPGKLVYQWELAEAYRKSDQCSEAAPLYGKVVSKDLGAKKRYPDARMLQALMEQCDLQPEKARKTWEKLIQTDKKQFGYRVLKAKNAIRGIDMMDSLRAAPADLALKQLGAPINTCNSEMSPRLHNDKLYFTTSDPDHLGLNLKQGEISSALGIASAEKTADGWGIPTPLAVNTSGATGNTAHTSEGHLVYSKKIPEGTKLFLKRWNGANDELKNINKKGNNTKPMVAMFNGQETLFFTSDRRGGSGGWDIWMCSINDGVCGSPRPIGAPINTPGDESCPFFDTEKNAMYFSSNFHPGMGGYDLFTSYPLREGFSRPVNWGYPLNTEADELYPAFYVEESMGFFSRIPQNAGCCENNNCCPDIFSFQYVQDTLPNDSLTTVVLAGTSEEVQSKLRGLLPIRLYFHNDEPNPRTTQTNTQFTYAETYEKYRRLIPRYLKEQGEDVTRVSAIQDFFDQEAEGNFNKLNKYLDLLQIILEKGDTVEITIRGFASPLAESDYNVNLSLRRISSLQNHLRTYKGGRLLPYLNSTAPRGQLIVSKAPYGESTSETNVSDQVDDLRNSVFSRGAAFERRIEVEAIDLFSAKIVTDTLRLTQDIGKVLQNMPKDIEFIVKNTRKTPLQFSGSKADCGCTNAQVPTESILPGEEQTVVVRFSGKAPEGPFERKVYLMSEGEPKVIELKIAGVILPLR